MGGLRFDVEAEEDTFQLRRAVRWLAAPEHGGSWRACDSDLVTMSLALDVKRRVGVIKGFDTVMVLCRWGPCSLISVNIISRSCLRAPEDNYKN
jgi:hypothetical protein